MIKPEIQYWITEQLKDQNFDSVALAVADLNTYEFDTMQVGPRFIDESAEAYFDLASLSKPLNFFPWYCEYPDLFSTERMLLLNHQAGLPVSGRLHRKNWREQILSYSINKSATSYSDFSPLRLMLELENDSKKETREIVKKYWDPDLFFWRDLPENSLIIPTGERANKIISGQVHDDKAFVIQEYTTHAGVFSPISSLIKTLIMWCKEYDLVNKVTSQQSKDRFSLGWDTVQDPQKSLAGAKSCHDTFGHLGFTGTSMWISPKNNKAIVLLTNETLGYWYDRQKLAMFRKELHDLLWV